MAKAKVDSKFPETIYVTKEIDNYSDDGYFLLANKSLEDSDEGEVAVYELVKVGKKITKTVFE